MDASCSRGACEGEAAEDWGRLPVRETLFFASHDAVPLRVQ